MSPDRLAALRAGDERAFRALVAEHGPLLMRLARMYTPSDAVAEEVVQETWLGVLNGLDGFQGRSSVGTWISRILVNVARRRGGREARSLPFSSIADRDDAPAVDPGCFMAGGEWAGHWQASPADWPGQPEQELLSREVRAVVDRQLARLSPPQREVVILRDVEGWPAEEVSALLEITPGHQRVLLHRGRNRVRAALERYFEDSP
jgi:RNA polymerase sigma-70 factor (ECF subfamily)